MQSSSPDDSVLIEVALRVALDDAGAGPPRLREALDHAVFPGGGRVRPRLCLAVADACGGRRDVAATAAAAVELLHCASLVHDDLPCFDDAATRRGRPAVHRLYGEATAVLVGDALIVAAFATVGRAFRTSPSLADSLAVLGDAAAWVRGLVAGQAWELEPGGPPDLTTYHHAKTASLFEAAAALGSLAAGLTGPRFTEVGRAVGLAYQIADDLADACATEARLGKPVGRDALLGRPTAASGGIGMARMRFDRAAANARAAIGPARCAPTLSKFVDDLLKTVGERALR